MRSDQPKGLRDALFLIGLAITFAAQLIAGLLQLMHSNQQQPITAIALLVIVCFLIGIARSWELVGGPMIVLHRELGALLVRSRAERHEQPSPNSRPRLT
jgi:hypothetical protein